MPGAVELQPDSPDPHVAVLLEYLRIAVLLRRPQYLGSRCTRTYGNGYDRENLPERRPMVLRDTSRYVALTPVSRSRYAHQAFDATNSTAKPRSRAPIASSSVA